MKERKKILASMAIVFLLSLPLINYEQDDIYIIHVYGKNLAKYGKFYFNYGEQTYGSTTFLLPLLSAFFHFTPFPLLLMKIFNITFTLLIIPASYIFARKFVRKREAFLLAIISFSPWFFRFSFYGMEACYFAVFLLVSFYVFLFKNKNLGAVLFFFTFLLRPEGLLILVILLFLSLFEKEYRAPLLIFSALLVPFFAYTFISFSHPLPSSAKSISPHFSPTNLAFFLIELLFAPLLIFKNKKMRFSALFITGFILFYLFLGSGSIRYMCSITPLALITGLSCLREQMLKKAFALFLAKNLLLLGFVYSFYIPSGIEFAELKNFSKNYVKVLLENTVIYVESLPGTVKYFGEKRIVGKDICMRTKTAKNAKYFFVPKNSEFLKNKAYKIIKEFDFKHFSVRGERKFIFGEVKE